MTNKTARASTSRRRAVSAAADAAHRPKWHAKHAEASFQPRAVPAVTVPPEL